jgi:hypothetical protein
VVATGDQLGPYKILAPLAAGGMGAVYKAKDTRLDRDVALKVLPESFARTPDRLARFQREGKALAALSHPNVLAIYDVGIHQSIWFVVVELLTGETLRARITRSALPWREAVKIALPVADGLAAAHGKGIIHRDLKPGNIFLTEDGQVKILDFGLACGEAGADTAAWPGEAGEDEAAWPGDTGPYLPAVTEAGMVLGTTPYLSPEQARGERVDARSDIFSFGCVLYEMLTGRPAFGRISRTETIAAILQEEPAALGLDDQMPFELNLLVWHCLQKNREKRFQSALDLARSLRSIVDEGVAARIPVGGLRPGVLINDLTQLLTKEQAILVRRYLPWYRRSGPGLLLAGICGCMVGLFLGRALAGTIFAEVFGAFSGLFLSVSTMYTMTISGLFDKQALRAAERALLAARQAAARELDLLDCRGNADDAAQPGYKDVPNKVKENVTDGSVAEQSRTGMALRWPEAGNSDRCRGCGVRNSPGEVRCRACGCELGVS